MKISATTVIGALLVCLGLLTTNSAFAQTSGSTLTQEEAISILQKAPGGEDLIFAGG